jgi:hypothetical protein
MFHYVGYVSLSFINVRIGQRLFEQSASWPDEWFATEILFISGLFSDEHHYCRARSRAKNRLRCPLPKIAGATIVRRFA